MFMTIDELKTSVIEGLTVELENEPDFSSEMLEEKVNNAVNEVMRSRRYKKAGYSQAQIEADIEDFISNIRNIALYDYNQIGGEFQTQSQENSVLRTYMNRRNLFSGIIPLAHTV